MPEVYFRVFQRNVLWNLKFPDISEYFRGRSSEITFLWKHIAASEPNDEKKLLKQPYVKNPEITVGDFVKGYIAKLGENIVVRRLTRMAVGEIN